MQKKKKPTLKTRGIRFSDLTWKKVSEDADKINSTPSEIIRTIIDQYYKNLESKTEKNDD